MKAVEIMDSIQARLLVSLVAAIVPMAGHAELRELTNFAGSEAQLSTVCAQTQGSSNCSIYDTRKGRRRKILSFPFPPSDIEYNSGVFVVRFPCGTACSATYFYRTTGTLSGPFPMVMSYDVDRGVVLGISDNILSMHKLFSKMSSASIGVINLDMKSGEDLANAIHDVKLKGHTFWITYTDRNGDIVTASQVVPRIEEDQASAIRQTMPSSSSPKRALSDATEDQSPPR